MGTLASIVVKRKTRTPTSPVCTRTTTQPTSRTVPGTDMGLWTEFLRAGILLPLLAGTDMVTSRMPLPRRTSSIISTQQLLMSLVWDLLPVLLPRALLCIPSILDPRPAHTLLRDLLLVRILLPDPRSLPTLLPDPDPRSLHTLTPARLPRRMPLRTMGSLFRLVSQLPTWGLVHINLAALVLVKEDILLILRPV